MNLKFVLYSKECRNYHVKCNTLFIKDAERKKNRKLIAWFQYCNYDTENDLVI